MEDTMPDQPTNDNLPEDADDAPSADVIPEELLQLSIALDTGDAATTAEGAKLVAELGKDA